MTPRAFAYQHSPALVALRVPPTGTARQRRRRLRWCRRIAPLAARLGVSVTLTYWRAAGSFADVVTMKTGGEGR